MGRGIWTNQDKRNKHRRQGRGRHEAGGSDGDQGDRQAAAAILQVPKEGKPHTAQALKGKPRTANEGDSVTQARRQAKMEAAELVRNAIKKQQTFKDIPRFKLQIVDNRNQMELKIKRWVRERFGRSKIVQSTHCKVPVTPPQQFDGDDESDASNMRKDEVSYYILVFLCTDGNLEALAREYDGYIIATRPEPTDKGKEDGWSTFSDVDLPPHLFGTHNWKMIFNSAYDDQTIVPMGDGSLKKMVKVLLDINEANCLEAIPERELMLDTLKVFGGEIIRLSPIFRFFLDNINSMPWMQLNDLSFWTTHWRKLGDAVLHLLLGLLAEKMNVPRSKKDALVTEAGLRKAAAVECLKGFELAKIAVRGKSFLDNIPYDVVGLVPTALKNWIDHEEDVIARASNVATRGEDKGGSSSSEDISLDLILKYIMLIKYEKTLVPELIMRRGGNTSAFEVKVAVNEKKEKKEEMEVGE